MKLSQFYSAIIGIFCAVIWCGCGNDDVIIDSSLPASTKIAFTSDLEGNRDIYVINADGTNLVNITKSETNNYEPAWSPDGKKIAFNSSGDPQGIYVMNADGTSAVNIYNDVKECWSKQPAWSPDGKKIAFQLTCTNVEDTRIIDKSAIYVTLADGTHVVKYTDDESDNGYPVWSPDGKKIVFVSFGAPRGIHVMNTDGTNAVKITKSEGQYRHPKWSPDGKKIAFTAKLSDNQEIYIMSTNGADVINLSNHPAADVYPAWSPDGKKIAFVSDRRGTFDLYVMNADGTNQIAIHSDRGDHYAPSWTSGE